MSCVKRLCRGVHYRRAYLVSLQVGQQLGTYTVVGPLGAGGMGEVYRATDTKLDREVAIKVLPDAMAYDRERVARFRTRSQSSGLAQSSLDRRHLWFR